MTLTYRSGQYRFIGWFIKWTKILFQFMLFCNRLIMCRNWPGLHCFIKCFYRLSPVAAVFLAPYRRLRRIVGDWTFDFFNGWPFFGESTDLLRRHEESEVSMSRVLSTFGFDFDCFTSKSIPFAPKSFDCEGLSLIGLARKIFITAQSSKNENIKRIPVTHPDTNIQFESDDLKLIFKISFWLDMNVYVRIYYENGWFCWNHYPPFEYKCKWTNAKKRNKFCDVNTKLSAIYFPIWDGFNDIHFCIILKMMHIKNIA